MTEFYSDKVFTFKDARGVRCGAVDTDTIGPAIWLGPSGGQQMLLTKGDVSELIVALQRFVDTDSILKKPPQTMLSLDAENDRLKAELNSLKANMRLAKNQSIFASALRNRSLCGCSNCQLLRALPEAEG